LRRAIAAAAGLLCLAWLAGLVWFATPPTPEDSKEPTDAIVVLTGGSGRIASGIDLLRESKGRELFVSGVDPHVGLTALLRVSGGVAAHAQCCVVLGHDALDTRENARETASWMRLRGYKSLRLVTAWYHLPRALIEFERAMPDVAIVPHPVFPDDVRLGRWWAWRGTATLLLAEYDKYLAALLLPFVAELSAAPRPPVEAVLRR
jgi:uncharacterized SAM-binding protein YcdF (DUF218 family)